MISAERMAALHARAFSGHGRPWRADEFADLLASSHVIARGDERGFGLSRLVADEAELLTLATDPEHRRQGRARAVLTALEDALIARGAARHFLEVAADNHTARALYAAMGYDETARRSAYYARPGGHAADAVIMSRVLGAANYG